MDRRVLIITGMHRSGTSAVASLLRRAGVDIGSRLIPSDTGNPHGYFEDEDFVDFHDRHLKQSGLRVLAQPGDELAPLGQEEGRLADDLVGRRRERDLWGWKDPRTSLFLDFWAERLPEARFLLMFRDPLEVVMSLLRRGFQHELEVMADPLAGLRSWLFYNSVVLDFYQRHGDRCFLAEAHQVAADPEGFVTALAAKLDLSLSNDELEGVVRPEELHHRPASADVDAIVQRLEPRVPEILAQLVNAVDWSAEVASDPCDPELAASLHGLSTLSENTTDPGSVAGATFALLLAYLDHESRRRSGPSTRVVQLLDRLVAFRRHAENLETELVRRSEILDGFKSHTGHLEKRVPELEAHGQALESRLAELEGHAANLEQREAETETQRRQLEASQAEAVEQLRSFRTHAENLETASRRDREALAELQNHVENLETKSRQDHDAFEEVTRHAENLSVLAEEKEKRIADLTTHAANLEARVAEAQEHSRALEEHVSNVDDRLAAVTEHSQVLESHAGELQRLLEQRTEHNQQIEAHAANLEGLREKDQRHASELEKHATALEKHGNNLETVLSERDDQLTALHNHVDHLEAWRIRDGKHIREMEQHANNLDDELARRKVLLDSAAAERHELSQQIDELGSDKEDLRRQLDDRQRRVEALEAREAELAADLERRQATVQALQDEARRLGGELEDVLDELHQVKNPEGWKRLRQWLPAL